VRTAREILDDTEYQAVKVLHTSAVSSSSDSFSIRFNAARVNALLAKVLSVAMSTFPQHNHGVSMLVSPIYWRGLDFIFGLEHVPKKLIDFFDQNTHHCLSDARGILLSSTSRPAKRLTRGSETISEKKL